MSIAHDHFHLFFQWKWLAWLFCSFFAFLTHFRPKYIQHNFWYWSHCLLSERWNAYRKVISLCYNVSRLFIMNVFLFVFLKYNTIICHEKQTIQVLKDAFFFYWNHYFRTNVKYLNEIFGFYTNLVEKCAASDFFFHPNPINLSMIV